MISLLEIIWKVLKLHSTPFEHLFQALALPLILNDSLPWVSMTQSFHVFSPDLWLLPFSMFILKSSLKCRCPGVFSSLLFILFNIFPRESHSPLETWLIFLNQFIFFIAPYIFTMPPHLKDISAQSRGIGWNSRFCNSASFQLGGWVEVEGYMIVIPWVGTDRRRKGNFHWYPKKATSLAVSNLL